MRSTQSRRMETTTGGDCEFADHTESQKRSLPICDGIGDACDTNHVSHVMDADDVRAAEN